MFITLKRQSAKALPQKVAAACALGLLLGTADAAQPQPNAQPVPNPSGDWQGLLPRGGVQLRIALHLGATSTYDAPDQGAMGKPATATWAGDTISVTLKDAGQFTGSLSPDGAVLAGLYYQNGSIVPIRFERGKFTASRRPQTPAPPFPYKVEEVSYKNLSDPGLQLAGTLTTPAGVGPYPVVLLITRSEAQDRDETTFEHKPFAVLADALTRKGVAVLRVDDRGVGGSGPGSLRDPTTRDLGTDVAAGVRWLKARKDIDPLRIGLLGHGEGGLIASHVASRDSGIAFVVMWAGPGVKAEELSVEQVRAQAAARGADPAELDALADLQRKLLKALLSSKDLAHARPAMLAAAEAAGRPAPPQATILKMNSQWYRYLMTLDPAPDLRSLKMPVLALLGGKDLEMSAQLNEQPLRDALARNPAASVEVLPGLNHLFQPVQSGLVTEYGQIEQTIDPAALNRMVDWIAQTASAKIPAK